MKKALISILAIIIAFSFISCGRETDNSKSETSSQTQTTTTVSQITDEKPMSLDEYYSSNFDKDSSGKIIKDIDADGVDDMIVCEIKFSDKKIVTDCNIYYFTVQNSEVLQCDKYIVNNSAFTNGSVFYNDSSPFIEDDGQYLEIYEGKDGYICCKFAVCYEAWTANYLLLKSGNKKITVVQHLFDPGYTSGIGLYYYDGYYGDYKKAELYAENEVGQKSGKYSSYKEALDSEIGKYGFKWKKSGDISSAASCVIDPSSDAELLYKLSD